MSHVGNGEHDFEDLERLNLDPDTREKAKQAIIEARTIIDSLEPRHITSWADLIGRLEDALEQARTRAALFEKLEVSA